MAGNELAVIKVLVMNKNKSALKHLGIIQSVDAPGKDKGQNKNINSIGAIDGVSTENAIKKADIYVNNMGVSIKQSGGSFSFNRLQRSNIIEVFKYINIINEQNVLSKIDDAVHDFHKGNIKKGTDHGKISYQKRTLKTY
jgi:hypothetical protein